jgi:Bacterial virulence factor lipase N-terminal
MNNKIRFFLLSSFVTFAFGLVACGSGSSTEKAPVPSGPDAFQAGTHPRFDPVISDIPFNTDLIFAKAAVTDGTADVGAASDPVRAAVNQLDGFSTSAFFDILISGSVNPSTATTTSVLLLELNTGTNDALNPANVVGVVGPATYNVQVVSLDGGTNNVIRVLPTQPLKAKTKYLVALTNDLKDTSGASLTRSWTYNALRDPNYLIFDSLLPVRTAILGWENLAGAFLAWPHDGLPAEEKERLILTYTFTTTDPLTPLVGMGAPRAAIIGLQVAAGVAPATAVANTNGLDAAGLLPTPKARSVGVNAATGVDFNAFSAQLAAGVGKLYTGFIKLPYYLTAYSGLSFNYLGLPWKPDDVLAGQLGRTVPMDVDGSTNVTYRYPFAKKTADESVPLQVTLPEAAVVPGYAGPANCGQIYAATGYPTVIYVHGITSDRTSVLALGHTLASKCIATVAIDLPLHGVAATNALKAVLNVQRGSIPFATLYGADAPRERHFEVAGAGGAPAVMNFDTPGATDGSGAQFINLGFLSVTRDNNRQAVMDLLNLNASLANINTQVQAIAAPGLNLSRIYVVGQSLGGILGSVFVTVNQLAIARDTQAGVAVNLRPISGVMLSTAGAQVVQILVNSQSFSPIINAGLGARGVTVGTTNYERFMYAAQSTVDSGDPVNFAKTLATLGVPVLLQQVNGDAVIPNFAASAPLMGTQALASLLDTTRLTTLGNSALGRGFVKHTAGGHSSLLRPEPVAAPVTSVTVEMQTQVVTFILNNATPGTTAVTLGGGGVPGNIDTTP